MTSLCKKHEKTIFSYLERSKATLKKEKSSFLKYNCIMFYFSIFKLAIKGGQFRKRIASKGLE
jgi:hypothetical protein